MKKVVSFVMLLVLLMSTCIYTFAENETKNRAELYSSIEPQLSHDTFSFYLCEAKTGKVLCANNEFSQASPASVTKIMTLLLVMEALESGKFELTDRVTVSAKAASMGGSQVFLEEGERITVEELIKSAVIASGNDASVALAELTAGSEAAFVKMMNDRAAELGMTNTNFENATGLDDDTKNHLTTAYDIALMSRELLKHDKITEYTTIWMDTVRNGEFGLSNTNRLVRFYKGVTGLKTGSTDKAGFCISASAKRDNLHLIAVIMGSETSNIRNAEAAKLLDYGFANYDIYRNEETVLEPVNVLGGISDKVNVKYSTYEALVNKGEKNKITYEIVMNENISAPIKSGDVLGKIIYKSGDKIIGEDKIYSTENIDKIGYLSYLLRVIKNFF
jgi:D-alanyl-D-alanine carboxypeptidase (penicillin-binding protein 5/6)